MFLLLQNNNFLFIYSFIYLFIYNYPQYVGIVYLIHEVICTICCKSEKRVSENGYIPSRQDSHDTRIIQV